VPRLGSEVTTFGSEYSAFPSFPALQQQQHQLANDSVELVLTRLDELQTLLHQVAYNHASTALLAIRSNASSRVCS
jgi:hypothetical protein